MRIKFNDLEVGYELIDSNNIVLFSNKDKKAIEKFFQEKVLGRDENLFSISLGDKGVINSYFVLDLNKEIRFELDNDAIKTYERAFETKKDVQDEEKFCVILKLKENDSSFRTDWKNSYDEAYDEMIEIKRKYGVENFSVSMIRGSVYIHNYETFKTEVELIKNATLASSSDNYSVIEKSLNNLCLNENNISLDEAKNLVFIECSKSNNLTNQTLGK